MKIYLHIGAAKCASSTIQNYFSYNNTAEEFMYGCLRETGEIIRGDDLKRSAIISTANYAVSSTCKNIDNNSFIQKLSSEMSELSATFDRVLLSCENWTQNYNFFERIKKAFQGHDLFIIFIVRPPVQWMNSSWWQWQQWEDIDLDSWVKNTNVAKSWLAACENYSSLDFVKKIHVLSLQKNILEQVGSILGVGIGDKEKKHNSSSSGELLRFLKMKRGLRVGAHDPHSEFVLNKYVSPRSKADWVLTYDNVKIIIDSSRAHCLELSKLVENENLLDNYAWWNVDYYIESIETVNFNTSVSYDLLADMLEEAYQIIIDMDVRSRRYELDQEQVTIIRDVALGLENISLENSYRLMKVVSRFRPNGPLVKMKLKEYKEKLNNSSR